MANKSENADIREMQTKMAQVRSDIKEVKSDVKSVLLKMDNLENVFVTRREIALVKAVIGIGFSATAIYIAVLGLK